MMKEWKGIMAGCGSFLNDLTIFISFHLVERRVSFDEFIMVREDLQ